MRPKFREAHDALMDLCGVDERDPTPDQVALRAIVFGGPVVRSFEGRGARKSCEELQERFLARRVEIQMTTSENEVRALGAWLVKVNARLAANQAWQP